MYHVVYWFSFCLFICCFWCRAPNADTVLVVRTPSGVFSARNRQNQKRDQSFRGSRLVSSRRPELPVSSALETNELEPLSAGRCRVFKRSINNVFHLCTLVVPLIYFLRLFITSHAFLCILEKSACNSFFVMAKFRYPFALFF